VILDVTIDKKQKVKIAHVYFEGNKAFSVKIKGLSERYP
jgi:hypothetical protein